MECANCTREVAEGRRGRCFNCAAYWRKHGTERPYGLTIARGNRPTREAPTVTPPTLWVDEDRAGHCVYAQGAWWQIPSSRGGWRQRVQRDGPPVDGHRVSAAYAATWLKRFGVPGVEPAPWQPTPPRPEEVR